MRGQLQATSDLIVALATKKAGMSLGSFVGNAEDGVLTSSSSSRCAIDSCCNLLRLGMSLGPLGDCEQGRWASFPCCNLRPILLPNNARLIQQSPPSDLFVGPLSNTCSIPLALNEVPTPLVRQLSTLLFDTVVLVLDVRIKILSQSFHSDLEDKTISVNRDEEDRWPGASGSTLAGGTSSHDPIKAKGEDLQNLTVSDRWHSATLLHPPYVCLIVRKW